MISEPPLSGAPSPTLRLGYGNTVWDGETTMPIEHPYGHRGGGPRPARGTGMSGRGHRSFPGGVSRQQRTR